MMSKRNTASNALIIVDLQNDFIPGGSLAIKEGHRIIPIIDRLLAQPFDVKVATKDWHPKDHGSFASNHPGRKVGDVIDLQGIQQILWPVHCVQETTGSEFAPGWDAAKVERVFHKGTDPNIDSYSTFFDNGHRKSTGLHDYLRSKNVDTIYIAGLATDYCVKYSVLDSRLLGFTTYVISDACRGVNLMPGDTERAFEEMRRSGASIITIDEVTRQLQEKTK